MKSFFFVKMSGAGNDFIMFDKNKNPGLLLNSDSIKKLCDRRNGIGADGVITISGSDNFDFVMEYFNADGSTGSLCGNGARCAIKFAESINRVQNKKANFLSNGVPYSGEILNENKVKFYFGEPKDFKFNFKVKAGGQLINANYVNTGSPHVVIKIQEVLKDPKHLNSGYTNINELPVTKIGKEIRNLPEFTPGGTNVNFIDIQKDKVFIRTYERGVENETLACGTGNAAAAIIANKIAEIVSPVHLITYGGDELIVNFDGQGENINDLTLTGPVKTVFAGEIHSTNFLN
ncbi:MAG TPA: diaminopimelate epimerase [Ignavibacteriaceae bacterium]|nr:diaminopimelate epimerase [Ignavibacteriaceae bacterium]